MLLNGKTMAKLKCYYLMVISSHMIAGLTMP